MRWRRRAVAALSAIVKPSRALPENLVPAPTQKCAEENP
jgi:hypothetical protein